MADIGHANVSLPAVEVYQINGTLFWDVGAQVGKVNEAHVAVMGLAELHLKRGSNQC